MMLSIIIVSFNATELLRSCLRSIYRGHIGFPFEVIVIDNASCDGAPGMVRSEFPQVRLIENPRNVGFAAANNQGLRVATGRFALLLNSDCEVLADALHELVWYAKDHPEAGIVAPQLLNSEGSLQLSGRRFPNLWRFFMEVTALYRAFNPKGYFSLGVDYTHIREVDEVTGAAMLVRGKAYETAGLLDERFFFYWEDIDWCRRIRSAGWKVVYLPDAKVVHHVAGSSRNRRQVTHHASLRSTHYYFLKHQGRAAAQFVKTTLVVREAVHLALAAATCDMESYQFRRRSLSVALRLS